MVISKNIVILTACIGASTLIATPDSKLVDRFQKMLGEQSQFEFPSDLKMGDSDVEAAAEALKNNNTVTILGFRSNKLGGNGVKVISDALMPKNKVKYLKIVNDKIGKEGSSALVNLLKNNEPLASLDLLNSGLGADGVSS